MRRGLRPAAALFALTLVSGSAVAQWAPTQSIRMLTPYAPGGAADIVARIVADKLSPALGQPVVVENRGGAGGIIGTELGAKAPPDGHTLIFGSDPPYTINPHLQKVPYDPLKAFEHVSLTVNVPLLLVVNPTRVPMAGVKELVAAARANPGKYTIASSGNGSSGHLAAELFKSLAGINLVHVAYKGQAPANTDVLGGQVDMTFTSVGASLQHLKTGRLKALAISTAKRFPSLPDLPTMAESGVTGYDIGVWLGASYPAGTPRAAVERINAEINKMLEMPDVRARLDTLGYVPAGGRPEVLTRRIESDYALFGKLIRENNIKGE